MTQKPLYRSLDANLALLEEMFGRSDDFYTKRLMLAGIPCAIVMFTGLSSPEKLCRMALDMLDRDPAMLGGGEGLCDYLLTQSRIPAEPDAITDETTGRALHAAPSFRKQSTFAPQLGHVVRWY